MNKRNPFYILLTVAGVMMTLALLQRTAPPARAAEETPIYVYSQDDKTHYKGTLEAPGVLTKLNAPDLEWVLCAEYIKGTLYVIDYFTYYFGYYRFGTIDTQTGAFTQIASGDTVPDAWGMAWNPVTDKVYVSVWGALGRCMN